MKKHILILFSFAVISLLFANENYSKKNQGTYIPYMMYEKVQSSKSYYEGIKATFSDKIYTVLCITDTEILSNLKFHDAYELNEYETDFSFEKRKGKLFLTDNKTGIDYIKISDKTDYYTAYDLFLKEKILKDIAKNNPDIKLKEDSVIITGYEWKIDKDQWHYSDNIDLILYSPDLREYIGISDKKIYALEDAEELKKVLGKEMLQ